MGSLTMSWYKDITSLAYKLIIKHRCNTQMGNPTMPLQFYVYLHLPLCISGKWLVPHREQFECLLFCLISYNSNLSGIGLDPFQRDNDIR